MPLSNPSLPELRERIANDLEFRNTDPASGESVDAHTPGGGYAEVANVVAGVAHGLYANQKWIADQILIATCADEIVEQRASEEGLTRLDPSFAYGALKINGTIGAVLPAGAVFQTSAGVQYRVNTETTFAAGVEYPIVTALLPGSGGNLVPGVRLDAVLPYSGIDSFGVTINPPISGGADIEPIERLRARLLGHRRQPPMGGNNYDYQTWAKEAHPSVTKAWVSAHESGIGSVVVRFVCEDLTNPIPTAPVVITVSDYVNSKKPAGLRSLLVAAPAAVPLNLVFTSLSANTPEVHAAIEAEVTDLFRREYTPGGPTTIPLTHVREAISRASGENDHVITLTTNLTYTIGQYPTWGVPTWPA